MKEARLALAATGIHPDRSRALLETLGAAAAVRGLAGGRLRASERVRRAAAADPGDLGAELAAKGLTVLYLGDPGYPHRLAELEDAPDVLFVRGRIPAEAAVAIVGTRRCTSYGRSLATAMGRAVADVGWVTVSGLARGIDVAAHRGTVDGSGLGVAVLGSGPDVWYPPEHRSIGLDLAGTGAVVSEYPLGTPPEPWRFPVRNRIIAGLSAAVVVVEAGERGGALITARLALEAGKMVFAVPGDVDREASRGTNLLIRDGAHPVLGAADLIAALTLEMGEPPRPPAADRAPLRDALGPTGASPDTVARRLGTGVAEVLAELTLLEAAGTVSRVGDRYQWTGGSPTERA